MCGQVVTKTTNLDEMARPFTSKTARTCRTLLFESASYNEETFIYSKELIKPCQG